MEEKEMEPACTSDGSREGVGELLHVFGLCLCLVVLPPEDDLNSALNTKRLDL